jgi:hypothetical protein
MATPPPAISCFMPCDFDAGLSEPYPFQEIDNAPDTKPRAKRDNKGLQHVNRTIEKCHIVFSSLSKMVFCGVFSP